jgi:hypothetical protein
MRYYIISIIIMLFGISIIVDPSAPMTLFDIPKGGNVEPIKYPLGLTFIVLGIMLFYSVE